MVGSKSRKAYKRPQMRVVRIAAHFCDARRLALAARGPIPSMDGTEDITLDGPLIQSTVVRLQNFGVHSHTCHTLGNHDI